MVDDACDIAERVVAMPKKYEEMMKPFQDIKIAEPDSVKQIMEELPPERAAALMVALMDLAGMVPASNVDTKAELAKLEKTLERLKSIRVNLRTASGDSA